MQDEINKLKEENKQLKHNNDLEQDIEYYVDPFVTRKSDTRQIKYCAACWVDKQKLVPIQDVQYNNYKCPLCKAEIIDMRDWEHRKDKEL